ncbi:MAG: hypothetical protein ACI9KE_004841, partial [Polyangiales bacterium]
TPGNDVRWEPLRELRPEHHGDRRLEGWLLTGWGVVSALGGLVMSIAGRNDAFWLSQGLTTLSFAAFNIPLGIGLIDVGGSRLRDIQNDRYGELLLYDEVLEAAISAQTAKRVSLAVNGALDVLYMVGGALLVGLASRTSSRNTAAGAGWAMIGQGAVLLGLDIYGVIEASRRAGELRRIRP